MVQNDYHINGVYKEYHSVRMVHIHKKMLVPYGTFITVIYLLKNQPKQPLLYLLHRNVWLRPSVCFNSDQQRLRVICSVISI